MSDIIEFLSARLDEEEQVALAASVGGRWRYSDSDSIAAWALYDESWRIASLYTYRFDTYDYAERMPDMRHPKYVDPDANGRHIARHEPTRVLAEVEAKRRIIRAYEQAEQRFQEHLNEHTAASSDLSRHHELTRLRLTGREYEGQVTALRHAVLCLTLPFAEHPDYRQEWKHYE